MFTNDSRKLLRPSKVDSWNMTKGIYQRNFQFPLIIKITSFSLTSPSSAFEYLQHSSTLLSLSMGRDRWHNFPAKSPGGNLGGGSWLELKTKTDLERILQNQVSARKLELNKIIFRQTLRLLTTNDLCFLLKSLCKPRMDTVLQNVDQCSDPPRLVTFDVHSVSIIEIMLLKWNVF